MDEAPIYAGPPPAAGAAFADNLKGFILAVASSAFIGASFIIKKKGLKRAGAVGFRAVIIGEIANFVAYIICSSCSCYSIGCFEHHRECRCGPFHFEREAAEDGCFGLPAWIFATVAISCIVVQLNYLNKALDTCNTAVVSPVYYAMFTILTILASAIMFKDWSGQSANNIASEICGLITVISGTTV